MGVKVVVALLVLGIGSKKSDRARELRSDLEEAGRRLANCDGRYECTLKLCATSVSSVSLWLC
jgi:hypothetical protein